jgi:hypothetical protein
VNLVELAADIVQLQALALVVMDFQITLSEM